MDDVVETESTGDVEADDDSKDLPVIFQCRSCNSILGDSVFFIAANNELKSITVQSVCATVNVSSKLVTSTNGVDQGSTYTHLVCKGCDVVVGKVYKTTPRILDDLRDMYTFDVNKLSVYQVGSASIGAAGDTENYLESLTSLKALKDTTLKLQVLMCAMHQRIANIEQALEIEEPEGQRPGDDMVANLLNGKATATEAESPENPRLESVNSTTTGSFLNSAKANSGSSQGRRGSQKEKSKTSKASHDAGKPGGKDPAGQPRSRKRVAMESGDQSATEGNKLNNEVAFLSPIRKRPNSRSYKT